MNAKAVMYGLGGLFLGIVLTAAVLFKASPTLMIVEDESPLSHDETVDAILVAAKDNNWKVPKIHNLQKTMKKMGHDVAAATVIEMCQPEHAVKVLADFDSRNVTSMMPCRVAVYETEDNRVIVSRMNSGLVAKVFNENVSEVMQTATLETEAILAQALAQ